MGKVLIVEDEFALRELYRLELADAGHTVQAVSEPSRALELVAGWRPDVVVLDIRLGGDNGLDLLRRIGAVSRDVRTILFSAHSGYRDDFSSWLADAFLLKSCDTSELCRKVNEFVATPAAT